MSVGISTACFYPEEIEKALVRCGELGAECVEVFFNAPSELEDGFLSRLKEICAQYRLNVVSVHPFSCGIEPFMLFSTYLRRFEDGRKFYREYARAAAALGARFVVMHGDSASKSVISPQEYTDRFMTINRDMNEYGVTLLQENVNAYKSASPEFITMMREYSGDSVSFVFDVKQSVRAGYTPGEILDAMGDRVAHIHLSDHNDTNDCLLPGGGSFGFAGLFERMENSGYAGEYVVELYRSAFNNTEEFAKSYDNLRQKFIYTVSR